MSQRTRRGLALWLTSSRTPVFVLDEQRMVLVFNQGCEELTGWTPADVIGKICPLQTEPASQQVEGLTSSLAPPDRVLNGESVVIRSLVPHRKGLLHEKAIHFFPLPGSGEKPTLHVLGIITDPLPEVSAPATRRFELAKHVRELHQRFQVDRLIARSPAMKRIVVQLEIASQKLWPIHFTGERGVGKEHLARIIHYSSSLKQKRFVPLRCATSTHFELHRTLQRLQEQPDEESFLGTVYLDRVDLLSRDLQEMVVEQMRKPGMRWLSSSANGLDSLTDEQISSELAALLTPLTLSVPPLRERSEDLLLLAQQILEERNFYAEGFSAEVETHFQQYHWPGNVEELSSLIHRINQPDGPVVELTDLSYEFALGLDAQQIRPRAAVVSLTQRLADFEVAEIEKALTQCRGNKSAAADLLGIPRAKLYRRLAQLGLDDVVSEGIAIDPDFTDAEP